MLLPEISIKINIFKPAKEYFIGTLTDLILDY